MKRLVIAGIFYDGYYDIWEDFLELKERFWKNCPYDFYIADNEKDLHYQKDYNVTVLHSGAGMEFSKKCKKILDSVEAEYYLLMLEDFFFTRTLNGAVLDRILDFMGKNNLEYYCMPMPEFYSGFRGTKDTLRNFEINSEYTVCCQPCIFKRDFFINCIGEGNYNAWVFEGIYCKSRYAHSREFLNKCKLDLSNPLGLRHGILKTKRIPVTVEYLNSIGYKMKSNRTLLSNQEYILYCMKGKIKSLLPLRLQRIIKKTINTGSVIEKYSSEIEIEIKRMGI